MDSSLKIIGCEALLESLSKLPVELSKRAERSALTEAMRPVLRLAKAKTRAIKDTGLLNKSIGISVKKGKSGLTARVGPRTGFKQRVMRTRKGNGGRKGYTYYEVSDPVKYAGVVEYGSNKVPARSFIRSSVLESQSSIMEGLARGYEKGIQKALDKLRKS